MSGPVEANPIAASTETANPAPPAPPKIKSVSQDLFLIVFQSSSIFTRHSFYQSDSVVTIQIPIKGLKKEQVQLETTDTTVRTSIFIHLTYILRPILLAERHDEDSSNWQ